MGPQLNVQPLGDREGSQPRVVVDQERAARCSSCVFATSDAKHGPRLLRSGRFFIAESLNAHASDRWSSERQKHLASLHEVA